MAPVITPRVVLNVRSAADVGLRHGGPETAATTVDPCTTCTQICDTLSHL